MNRSGFRYNNVIKDKERKSPGVALGDLFASPVRSGWREHDMRGNGEWNTG